MPTKEQVEAYDLRYLEQARCVMADGTQLYYETRGSGPYLTLVNNMFLVSPLWRPFTGRLEAHRTLLTYDMRNQGASTMQDSPVTLDQHVEDLRMLLDHVGVEKTMLMGTSVSTLITKNFAARYPERVSGLILVGPSFSPFGSARRELIAKSWLKALQAGGPSELFSHIYPQVFGDKAIQEGGAPGYLALRERFLALNSPEQLRNNLGASLTVKDDAGALAGLGCPVLLMAGDGDVFASRSSLEELAKLLPDARVDVVPYAGHVPYFDAPDAFQESVIRFLTDLDDRAAAQG